MSRLILMILLGLVAAYYFPDSRQMMLDAAEPVLQPVFRWQTKHEMEEVVRSIRTHERENYGTIPGRREWGEWLEINFVGDAGRDSWGQAYFLQARRDSFFIISSGPDMVYRTPDDIELGAEMSRPDRN